MHVLNVKSDHHNLSNQFYITYYINLCAIIEIFIIKPNEIKIINESVYILNVRE